MCFLCGMNEGNKEKKKITESVLVKKVKVKVKVSNGEWQKETHI